MRRGWIVVLTALLACGGAFGQGEPAALDIDGNGEVDALTDGLLALRYLFGFRGAPLTTGAVGSGCTRCDAEEVEEYLDQFAAEFDIDGNGEVDALTDGLLALRYLFGFRGDSLTAGALAPDCARCDLVSIEARLSELANPSIPAGSLYATDPIAGNLRFVPAGTFTQGSPASEPCRMSGEGQFLHTLTKKLAVMETEVTRQMWADLRAVQPTLPADPTRLSHGAGMSNPVQDVTWAEAVLFANLLSLQQGLTRAYYVDAALTQPVAAWNTVNPYVDWNANGYRLPTEGEWEYFARAGTSGPFSVNEPHYSSITCGSASCTAGTLSQVELAAWFCANRTDPAGDATSKPAGLKVPNPWGLRDVHGNVWEWVWDRHAAYPGEDLTDYRGPASGWERVLRGGSWGDAASGSRSAIRNAGTPSERHYFMGFRLVRAVN